MQELLTAEQQYSINLPSEVTIYDVINDMSAISPGMQLLTLFSFLGGPAENVCGEANEQAMELSKGNGVSAVLFYSVILEDYN